MTKHEKLLSEFNLLYSSRNNISDSSRNYLSSLSNNLGKHFYDTKNFKKAIFYYETELEISITTTQIRSAAIAHNRLALCFGETRKYKKAIFHMDAFRELAYSLNDPILIYQSSLNTGYIYLWRGSREQDNDFETKNCLLKAKKHFEKAFLLFQDVKVGMMHSFDDGKEMRRVNRQDLLLMKRDILYAQGCALFEEGEFESSIQKFKAALKVSGQDNSNSHILSAIGNAFKELGMFEKSEKYLGLDRAANKQTCYEEDLGACLFNLANLYIDKKNFRKANEFSLKFLKVAKKLKNRENILKAQELFEKTENLLRTLYSVIPNLESQAAKSENKNEDLYYETLYQLGQSHSEVLNFEKALDYFKLSSQTKNTRLKANSLSEIGACALTLKRFKDSVDSFKSAVEVRLSLVSANNDCDSFAFNNPDEEETYLELAYDYLNLALSSYENKEEPFVILDLYRKSEEYALISKTNSESDKAWDVLDVHCKAINGQIEILFEAKRESEAKKLKQRLLSVKREFNESSEHLKIKKFLKNDNEYKETEIFENGSEHAKKEKRMKLEIPRESSNQPISTREEPVVESKNEFENSAANSDIQTFKNENFAAYESKLDIREDISSNEQLERSKHQTIENRDTINFQREDEKDEIETSNENLKTSECRTSEVKSKTKLLNDLLEITAETPFKLPSMFVETELRDICPGGFEWQFLENKTWKSYDSESSKEIEEYYRGQKVMVFRPTKGFFANNSNYSISLIPSSKSPHLFTQKNLSTGSKKNVQRVAREFGFPMKTTFLSWVFTSWCLTPERKVVVSELSKEFEKVQEYFKHGLPRAKVNKIWRIQNSENARRYIDRLQTAKKHVVNEEILFHGADNDSIEGIINQGFDIRLNGKNATRYGKGTYFSASSLYSSKFSKMPEQPESRSERRMVVARVITGRRALGKSYYSRPPPLDCKKPHSDLYDSTVDNLEKPSIFVVYTSEQAYPLYVIDYSLN